MARPPAAGLPDDATFPSQLWLARNVASTLERCHIPYVASSVASGGVERGVERGVGRGVGRGVERGVVSKPLNDATFQMWRRAWRRVWRRLQTLDRRHISSVASSVASRGVNQTWAARLTPQMQ